MPLFVVEVMAVVVAVVYVDVGKEEEAREEEAAAKEEMEAGGFTMLTSSLNRNGNWPCGLICVDPILSWSCWSCLHVCP